MTCIIAYIDSNGNGHMAGDSDGIDVSYHSKQNLVQSKIFNNGEFLIGFTSSFRMGQLLRYNFIPPECPNNIDEFQYMVGTFVPAVRNLFLDFGFMLSTEKTGGQFLVIFRGRLFSIYSDFSVFEPSDFMDACGSGAAVAQASFATMQKFGIIEQIGIKSALKTSIGMAEKSNITVSGRIDYLEKKYKC